MNKKVRAGSALVLTCALLLLFISSRVWITVIFSETNAPTLVLPITGRSLDPLGAGCSWALVASVLAYLVSRGLLRKLISITMLLLSGTALISAWHSHGDAVAGQVSVLTSQAVGRTVTDVSFTSNYLWVLALVSSGLCLIASLLLLIAPSSPVKPSRYDRSQNPTELSPWQAIDAGLDPTQD